MVRYKNMKAEQERESQKIGGVDPENYDMLKDAMRQVQP